MLIQQQPASPGSPGSRSTMSVLTDGAGEMRENFMEGISDVGSSLAKGFKSSILGGLMGQAGGHNKRGAAITSNLVKVSFEDEKVEIPACHGNAVIRFEFMDGE
jgi:hypothetical protein